MAGLNSGRSWISTAFRHRRDGFGNGPSEFDETVVGMRLRVHPQSMA